MVKSVMGKILNKVGVEPGRKSGEIPEEVTGIRWRGFHEDVWRKNGPGRVPKGISSGFLFFHTLLLLVDLTEGYNAAPILFHKFLWTANKWPALPFELAPGALGASTCCLAFTFWGLWVVFLPSKWLALYYAKHSMGMSFLLCTRQLNPENVY